MPPSQTNKTSQSRASQAPPKLIHPTLPWDERETLAGPAFAEQGAAKTVKITLVGRPDAVIVTLASRQPPPLPKGLPVLPDDDLITVFLVYIAYKQWQKVAAAMQNPEDRLVIEGYPFMDPKLKVIGVLTQNVTTVLTQRAQRTDK